MSSGNPSRKYDTSSASRRSTDEVWYGQSSPAAPVGRAGRELADEVFVGVADHVEAADPTGPQVEPLVVEVFEERLEPGVPLPRLPQAGFRVEVNASDGLKRLTQWIETQL